MAEVVWAELMLAMWKVEVCQRGGGGAISDQIETLSGLSAEGKGLMFVQLKQSCAESKVGGGRKVVEEDEG